MCGVSKRTRNSESPKTVSSSQETSDIGQKVNDFFALRCRNKSRQLSPEENISDDKAADDRSQKTASSSLARFDSGQTMDEFFAQRRRSKSKQLGPDENFSDDKAMDDEPQADVKVNTENVRRSSRLSAQAAAAAIARAIQVTLRQ